MEAQQCVELTGTNRSNGLSLSLSEPIRSVDLCTVFRRPGGYGGVSEPDPIPNSVVKRLSADGTSSRRRGRVGRCQACERQTAQARASLLHISLKNPPREQSPAGFPLWNECIRFDPGGLSYRRNGSISTQSGLAGRMKQSGDPFTFAQLIVKGDSLLGRQDVRAHASFRQELERFGANLQALPLPS